jgi:quercetin dioxygenase-like cupin family protein
MDAADAARFGTRGFDGERVTRNLAEVTAPASPGDAPMEVLAVHFEPGERTGVHRHLLGQVLIVLHGRAEVVTDDERVVAGPGDIVIAAPGEWHWHGTVGDEPMAHLAIHRHGPGLSESRPA